MQFAYMMLVGSFPFNGFLAGFLSTIGFFSLTGAFALGRCWRSVIVVVTSALDPGERQGL